MARPNSTRKFVESFREFLDNHLSDDFHGLNGSHWFDDLLGRDHHDGVNSYGLSKGQTSHKRRAIFRYKYSEENNVVYSKTEEVAS